MKFIIKNTLEDGCLMYYDSNKWELSLRVMNQQLQGVLTFEAKYLTSMSEQSYYKIKKLFESKEILDVEVIVINDWDVSFIKKGERT